MYPFFFKIVHYVDKTESFVDMSYFLKIAVLSPILSTKRLLTTALIIIIIYLFYLLVAKQ